MRRIALVVLLVAACSKKSDDKCARVVDKSMKVLQERAALSNLTLGKKERDELIAECRRATRGGKVDKQVDCVDAAKDDAGIRDCYMKGYEERLARAQELEPKVQLARLGKNAKAAFVLGGAFPAGKVGPTPATACCAEQIKQCIPTDAMWADPVWRALEFAVDGAFGFQYAYESDGKTFTATATGDVGCTGKPATHTLTGKVGADGNPELTGP